MELGFDTALFGSPLSLAAYQRRNAGNLPGLSDRGAALTWRTAF
jgi:hypothetical protein